MNAGGPCRWRGDTLICELRVQPRAGQDRIAGRIGERLKIRIGSAPVDGAANKALVRFLSGQFGVTRSRVRLVAGHRGRNKTVEIECPQRLPREIRDCMDI